MYSAARKPKNIAVDSTRKMEPLTRPTLENAHVPHKNNLGGDIAICSAGPSRYIPILRKNVVRAAKNVPSRRETIRSALLRQSHLK